MSDNPNTLKIKLSKRLPGKKRDVLLLLANVEALASFVPVILEAKTIAKEGECMLTSWHVEVDGLPIHWQQKSLYYLYCFSFGRPFFS